MTENLEPLVHARRRNCCWDPTDVALITTPRFLSHLSRARLANKGYACGDRKQPRYTSCLEENVAFCTFAGADMGSSTQRQPLCMRPILPS